MEIKTTISDKRIRDLIITGFESGSYGSFIVVGYDRPSDVPHDPDTGWPSKDYPGYAWWPLIEGCATLCKDKYECDEHEEEEDDTPVLRLDLETVQRGLQLMQSKFPRHFGDFMGERDDAITGDVFLQCCLLGDVIYG